jgi:ABC-type multidrug transport system fused ATPase/permease subunit
MFFSYLSPLIDTGNRRPLRLNDMPPLKTYDKALPNLTRFQSAFTRRTEGVGEPDGKHLVLALWDTYGTVFLWAFVPRLVFVLLEFFGPLAIAFLSLFLEFPDDEKPFSYTVAYALVALLFIAPTAQAVLLARSQYVSAVIGMNLRTCTVAAIAAKSLRMPPGLRNAASAVLINTSLNDSARLEQAAVWAFVALLGVVEIALSIALLLYLVGVSAIAGVIVLILAVQTQTWIVRRLFTLRRGVAAAADRRVLAVTETIAGMRAVKLWGAEKRRAAVISAERERELGLLFKSSLLRGFMMSMLSVLPTLIAMATFTVFAVISNVPLTPATAFATLATFNILRVPLSLLPTTTAWLLEAWGSARRVAVILSAPELECYVARTATRVSPETAEFSQLAASRDPSVAMSVLKPMSFSWQFPNSQRLMELADDSCSSPHRRQATRIPARQRLLRFARRGHRHDTSPPTETTSLIPPEAQPLLGGTQRRGSVDIPTLDATFGTVFPSPDLMSPDAFRPAASRPQSSRPQSSRLISSTTSPASSFAARSQLSPGRWAPFSDNRDGLVLRNLRLSVKHGTLVILTGAVGSGKSSAISALLGELHVASTKRPLSPPQGAGAGAGTGTDEGQCDSVMDITTDPPVYLNGSAAVVSQQPALLNATLRNNILFGRKYDQERYEWVLDRCCLVPDLQTLPAGDRTEIGAMGLNLSGGQKARVALARAVYAEPDLLFLDGVLAAVDAETGSILFALLLHLRDLGRTIVLASHALQYLPRADQVVLLAAGRIVATGTYDELSSQGHDFAGLQQPPPSAQEHLPSCRSSEQSSKTEPPVAVSDAARPPRRGSVAVPAPSTGRLTQEEFRATGTIKLSTYAAYVRAMGGRKVLLFGIVPLFFLSHILSILFDAGLAAWTSSDIDDAVSVALWLDLLGVVVVAFVLVRQAAAAAAGVRASRHLHAEMMSALLASPISFFDTTPAGRIINRVSRDVDSTDTDVSFNLSQVLSSLIKIATALCLIAIIAPTFILPAIPLLFLYGALLQRFRGPVRDLKRLDAHTVSSICQRVDEAVRVGSTAAVFGRQQSFLDNVLLAVDTNNRVAFALLAAQRWVAVRLDILSAALTCAVAAVVVSGSVDAGAGALALTYGLTLTSAVSWGLRWFVDAESELASVERIVEYCSLPSEPAAVIPDAVPQSWPAKGEVEFKHLVWSHRPELPPALDDFSAKIPAGCTCGVVGRTGSGKSSCIASLLRLAEATSGQILIDGVDISRVGLDTLRRRVGVVTQDPTVFSGTVRDNIDPSHYATNAELWASLATIGLQATIREKGGLDAPLAAGGSDLSAGERQLLCLVAALQRRCRILVADEASSCVDRAAEAALHEAIVKALPGATLIVIAHRLQTIADADYVLVLGHGRAIEFGTPAELLGLPNGAFTALVEEAGPQAAAAIRAQANAHSTGTKATASSIAVSPALQGAAIGR